MMPHNYLPVGSERVSRDGYIEVYGVLEKLPEVTK